MTSEPVRVNGTTLEAREVLRAHLLQEESKGHAGDVGDWAFLLYVEVKGTRSGREAYRIYHTSHPGMGEWGRQATKKMSGTSNSTRAQLHAQTLFPPPSEQHRRPGRWNDGRPR